MMAYLILLALGIALVVGGFALGTGYLVAPGFAVAVVGFLTFVRRGQGTRPG